MLVLRRFTIFKLLMLTAMVISSAMAPASKAAAAASVRAAVADFPIRINGQLVDNAHTAYPFLLYNGITYAPLTWDNTTALGIHLFWSEDGVMHIRNGYGKGMGNFIGWKKQSFKQDLSANRRLDDSYIVTKAAYPIVLEDHYFENEREPYPLLEYKGITYLPLTWHIVHDMLRLSMTWDSANGLGLIGGQQPVLGSIVFDDEDYLYVSSVIITEEWHSGLLKLNKSLEEKPVWMTKDEAQQLQKKIDQAREGDPFRGKTAAVEAREDGLYVGEAKLLEADEMKVPGGMQAKVVFTATHFELDSKRSLLAVRKQVMYVGASQFTNYVFLMTDGKAAPIREITGAPYRVVPNADGTFWIAADGRVTPRSSMNLNQLALLDRQGNIRLLNKEWNELGSSVIGFATKEGASATDGRLLVHLADIPFSRGGTVHTPGIYEVDSQLNVYKVMDPLPSSAQLYMGSDKMLYTSGEEINTITNKSAGTTAMWYDYELVASE